MSDETLIRLVLAACGMMDGRPMFVGFMPHPMAQLPFVKEKRKRDIYRHPSETLATVNEAGNLKSSHLRDVPPDHAGQRHHPNRPA